MSLTSPKTIKELLAKHGAKPNKILGQNFLIDNNILKKIIDSADLKQTDTVLEVGPGIGTLTQELAKYAKKVIGVEKDKKMIEILKETLAGSKNVEIIRDDIRYYSPKTTHYKLIANIPYYLTSPLIRKFLETDYPPSEMILMVQKEVAQRICSKPPSPPTNFGHKTHKKSERAHNPKLVGGKMSLLAVSVQFYAEPKIISYVSKNCFLPAPKVDSAIIKITPFSAEARLPRKTFFKIVKAGFSQPRKQLAGNLSKMLKINKKTAEEWLQSNGIKPSQRAETLSISDWKNLTETLP
ncbi:MAG: rRNA adenine dimethyltransferase family protein [bacterium]